MTGRVQLESGAMSSLPRPLSGAEGLTPREGRVVNNVYIDRPKQVFLGNENVVGLPPAGIQQTTGVQGLCPKSMMVALLKEILFHCPRKREALFTLEDKLCKRLREVLGKHIVSFEEHFEISFRQFLAENSETFEVKPQNSELIVSRVTSNPDKLISPAISSDKNLNAAENPRNVRNVKAPNKEPMEHLQKEEAKQKNIVGKETESVPITSSPLPESCKKSGESSFIAGFLDKEPNDTLIFKVSADAYKDDHVQFTIDVVSLWNTPKRNKAIIILGVKHLISPPHQVVGLKCGSSLAFYQKIFIWHLFDSVPKFSYREIMHDRKLVGVIQVEKSAESISPSIVKSDKKRPRLRKNQLWVREEGKSIAIEGSDFSDARVKRVYSWFMQSPKDVFPERSHSQQLASEARNSKTARQSSGSTEASARSENSGSSLEKTCTSHEEGSPPSTNITAKTRPENLLDVASAQEPADSSPAAAAGYKSFCTQNTPINSENVDSVTEVLEHASFPASEGILCATTSPQNASNPGSLLNAQFASGNPQNNFDPAKSPDGTAVSCANLHDAPTSPKGQLDESVQSSDLMKALAHFKKGHFVLLCGTLPNVAPNLDALSNAPWIAVFDFDVNSRDTGLLAYLEDGLRKKRSTSVSTWMDHHSGVTERGTQWWSLRGRLDLPHTNLSDLTPLKWLQKTCDKIEKLCVELARFSQDYTILSILVLWPNSKEEMRCMQKFLSKLLERIHVAPSILLWFTDSKTNHADTFEVRSITEDSEDNVKLFHLSLEEFCAEVESTLGNASTGIFQYQLPSEDSTPAAITLEEAAFLKQDFEVLYLQNPYGKQDVTTEDLQREGDNFFRGGSINWFARYDMGPTCFDIERSISRQITKHIQKVYIDGFKGGVVRLFHAPGSGGSTMSQRILFDLHEITPCVHVKQRSGSSAEEIAERLASLFRHTHMPVVALFDGEDEQKVQQLRTQLRHCTIVFLHVKRYPYPIDESRPCSESQSKFFLQGVVSRQESRNLVLQFSRCCNGAEGKLRALSALDKDVQQNQQQHQMFEYGLTVYDHEYKGVRAYVNGYLQIEQQEGVGLEPWQKALGYLSLVYYYAQASLSCQFIGTLMKESTKQLFSVHDLPHRVRMLVVVDTNEGKSQCVRIMHYAIATEILEQILNKSNARSGDGKLSEDAKTNLKDFCIDFLDVTVKGSAKSSLTAQTVMYVLTKTFIIRDTADVFDCQTEAKQKPPRFSQIMQDLDSHAPYNGRLAVLQKLCDVCPDNPNIKAHLGRFYSLCQPHEEEEAESNFKKAISLARESDRKRFAETGDQFNLDLMYIYHMYACFFQRKIKRRISSVECSGSGDESAFRAKLCEVIEDADQACRNFSLSRFHSSPSNQEAHPYFHEIDVRLHTCKFILHSFPGDVQALLQSWQEFGVDYTFVKTSIFEIEDLIMECYNEVLLDDDTLIDLQKRVRTFNSLFRGCVKELQALADDDPLTTLRLKVSAKKLQYDRADNVVFVENPHMPSDVMQYVVETYERIFDYESFNHDTEKNKLELDYRDWILAIRNPNFPQDYTVEKVLDEVRRWRSSVRSPQSISTFYLFVVLSLLGFGTSTKSGSEACLEEANDLKDTMRKHSRTDPKARLPREWLGREESSGIRRLVPHSNIPVENHRVTGAARAKLAVCKGTVMGKPIRASGCINLDLKDKSSPVKVFFVPARTGAAGTFLKGARVQFFLGFTQEKGYEAFEVTLLKRCQCPACGIWVEIKTDQDSVLCHGQNAQGRTCGTRVFRK